MSDLKKTPLHAQHLELGARMVPFGGWDMPVQYEGVIAEHLAVRERAGVFDVSHMGEFVVCGPQALEFLQYLTVNDASKLRIGRAHYNMLPNAQGGLVDDIYVYRLGELEYLVVVNAGNIDKDWAHVCEALAERFGAKVASPRLLESADGLTWLENQSDSHALLAVQGPLAAELLAPHSSVDLAAYKKNSVFSAELFGLPVMLARTGYTGEDGFEVFSGVDVCTSVWRSLVELGLTPCGLGARDTLRLEAGFPLYGHEFTDTTSPLETPMRWAVKEYKAFLGRDAMTAKARTRELVGVQVTGRGIPREGYALQRDGLEVGRVTSGTMSPSLKIGIALAYVDASANLSPGDPVQLEVRGTLVPAEIVEPVFVSRSSPGQ